MQKDLIRSDSARSSGKWLEVSLSCQNGKKGIFEALQKMTGLVHGLNAREEESKKSSMTPSLQDW